MIRIGSSTGQTKEAPVDTWLGGGLPPMGSGFIRDFTTRYMDPTEVYARFAELQAEFPNISELIALPYKTNGYQRRAQATMAGTTPPGNSPPGATAQSQAVVLTSRSWGHEGGNDITAEFLNPGVPNSPLSVQVTGKDIVVNLGTDATGALASTAAQVVSAINGSPAASMLVVALTYRGNAGAGIVQPRAKVNLSDFLTTATNAHVPRGPFQYYVMRIGKVRDGSRVGVFLYCQQHAREWATPLTCLETAEELLRNYAIDGETRKLVDNLDIFILPSSNPDGAHYSIHNFSQQRRNMTNHCVVGGKSTDDPFAMNFWSPRINPGTGLPYTNSDPASRNAWGVDLNRNNTFATLFDGYIGASTSCISDVYAGPAEASEPEIKNELWVADTFSNIKFSNNADRFVNTTLSVASAAGATAIRAANRTGFSEGDKIKVDAGTANEEIAIVASIVNPNPPSPNPNVILTAPLTLAHPAGAVLAGGTLQSGVGFQPDYATEGKQEALEFAAGNYGLLESAYDYAFDTTPPEVDMPAPTHSKTPIETTFVYVNEPSVIRYTTDGSKPTESSPLWDSTGPREPGQVFHITEKTKFRWIATDMKGNVAKGQKVFVIAPRH